MKNELISVIIPIYNCELFLEKCINSITTQTYKNLEIILVNDGSTDNSKKICEQYAKKESRIKVIHKKNGGAAEARNVAIKEAKGKLITFVDADDEILPNYIQNMYELIRKYKTKLAITSYIVVGKKNKIDIGKKYKEQKIDTKECLERLLLQQGFTVSPCAKMYEKELLLKHPFPEKYPYEDDATTYKIIMECDEIAYNNQSNYLYYKRENSVTNKSFSKDKLILLKYGEEMQNKILNKYPELKETVIAKCISYKFSILRQMTNAKLNSEMKKTKNEIKKTLKSQYKEILKSSKSGMKDKCAILSLLLGEWYFKLCWNLYEKIKY